MLTGYSVRSALKPAGHVPADGCARASVALAPAHVCTRTSAYPRVHLFAPASARICAEGCGSSLPATAPRLARACVCTRVFACVCACVSVRVRQVCACVCSSVCARARVCWSLRCRRIARRNIPGCLLHHVPLQPVHGALWHAPCALWFCAALHAVRCAARGDRILAVEVRAPTHTESARGSSRVRLCIARAARRVVGRCCARPTCTRPGQRARCRRA